MKNKIFVCAAVCVLAAALTALMAYLLNRQTEAPDYVFEDFAPSSHTETAANPPNSAPVPQSSESEAPSGNTALLSHDPLNYAEISLGENTRDIFGRYEKKADAIVFGDLVVTPEQSDDGTSFTAHIDFSDYTLGYHYLIIHNEDNSAQSYRVCTSENGAVLVGGETADKNSAVISRSTEISPEICAMYISSDGNEAAVRETLDEIQRLSDEICAGIESDYDKLRALSRWVSENIYYDYDARDTSITVETISLRRVLALHRSVCGGFSNLFAALCEAQGIRCYNVRGSVAKDGSFEENSASSASHEWAAAEIGGRMIWVDTVWNTSNSYSSGEYIKGVTHMKFFDIDDLPMGADHRAERCELRSYFGCLSAFENTQPQ